MNPRQQTYSSGKRSRKSCCSNISTQRGSPSKVLLTRYKMKMIITKE